MTRPGYAAESSLTATLRIMERNGFLVIQGGGEKGRSRVVRLTAKARFALGAGGIPLLGTIPAGPLQEAFAQADEIIDTTDLLPSRGRRLFLARSRKLMTGDGILDGDWVLLRQTLRSSMVRLPLCLWEKRMRQRSSGYFLPEKAEIVLRASNPRYPDLVVNAQDVKVRKHFSRVNPSCNLMIPDSFSWKHYGFGGGKISSRCAQRK